MRGESVIAGEMTGKLVAAYRGATAPPSVAPVDAAAPAARLLTLSPREQAVQHILRKLDVSSRVQAAVIAVEHGLA